ncbi:MAG: hypothetical protein DRJ64_00950 [Thermoprotei archaeon]|nr:MAG: hypothetical protein DRJ64_00950 [Thermoprotei archaeon]
MLMIIGDIFRTLKKIRGLTFLIVLVVFSTISVIGTPMEAQTVADKESNYKVLFERSMWSYDECATLAVTFSPQENSLYVLVMRLLTRITKEEILKPGYYLYALDFYGNILWKNKISENYSVGTPRVLLVSEDNTKILVGGHEGVLLADKRGKILWMYKFESKTPKSYHIQVKASSDLKRIVVQPLYTVALAPITQGDFLNGTEIWLLNEEGKILWKRTLPEDIMRFDVDQQGEIIAIRTRASLYIINATGSVLWSIHGLNSSSLVPTISYALCISKDGKYIAFSNGTSVYVFSLNKKQILNVDLNDTILSCWIIGSAEKLLIYTKSSIVLVNRDGKELLRIPIHYVPVWSWVLVSMDKNANYMVISIQSKNENTEKPYNNIYFINSSGNIFWNINRSDIVLGITLSEDGSKLAFISRNKVVLIDTGVPKETITIKNLALITTLVVISSLPIIFIIARRKPR